ncbi:MAG: hypothetical protein DRG78_06265 [Epsilonproteobacteria bacterium]|nr:MAG: hypothetical protein DRG78_06265 [Campylobacterota bacterium]
MKRKQFKISVKIYPELAKYKDEFHNAITLYQKNLLHNCYINNYKLNSKKITIRLSISWEPEYYRNILKEIEQELQLLMLERNKGALNQSILINNILATLIEKENYN